MKKVDFSPDELPGTDEINDLLRDMMETGGSLLNHMFRFQD